MKLSLSSLVVVAVAGSTAMASVQGLHRRRQHHSMSRITHWNGTKEENLYPRAGNSKWTWYDTEESGNA